MFADFTIRGNYFKYMTNMEKFGKGCNLPCGEVSSHRSSFHHGVADHVVMRGSQGLCFLQREHISLNSLAKIGPPDGISASLLTLD